MRQRFPFLSGVLALLIIGAASVSESQAAEPFDAIPRSASFVVRVKNPQSALKKLDDYFNSFKTMKPPSLHDLITDEVPEGIDFNQGLWFICFTTPRSMPGFVAIAMASDPEKALQALKKEDSPADGRDVDVVGNMVLVSNDKQAFVEVRKCLKGESPSLWPTMDEASRRLFEGTDISILVNVPKVADVYEADLAQSEAFVKSWIEDFYDGLADEESGFVDLIKPTVVQTVRAGLQAVRDLNCLTAGITISDSWIRYEDRWQFKDGSPSSAILAQNPASDLGLMTRFPSKQTAYVGLQAGFSPQVVSSLLTLMQWGLRNSGDDQKAIMSAVIADVGKLKFGEYAVYLDSEAFVPAKGGKSALRFGSVTVVEPGELWRSIALRLAKLDESIGDFQVKNFKRTAKTITIEPAIAHTGGIAIDRFTSAKAKPNPSNHVSFPFDAADADQYYRFGPKQTLATTGGETADLVRLTKTMDPARPANREVAVLRERLFPHANLVALIDVARMAVNVIQTGVGEDAADQVVEFNEWKFEPSYIGYAVKCEATSLRTQLEIPVQQASNIASFLIPILMNN